MTTQIVYVLISSDKDLYLEEFWASLFSLRIYHPEVTVKVLADKPTATRIDERPQLRLMISSVVIVDVPEHYSPKERSRQIKTTVRNVIDGPYLFIDTDTIICKPLNEIDKLTCDIAAVPDGHQPLVDFPFNTSVYGNLRSIWGTDVSDANYWFNSGVMFVADNQRTHEFYRRWNENWTYSCFKKGNSQDQPALLQTDKEYGYFIKEIDGIYNAQVALSLKYFADAAILHWWHMDFIEDQNYSPYFSLAIYRDIKQTGCISPSIADLIRNAKRSFVVNTMPVGIDQMLFLFNPAGKHLVQIHKEGGAASWLMQKMANWLWKLHRITKKK